MLAHKLRTEFDYVSRSPFFCYRVGLSLFLSLSLSFISFSLSFISFSLSFISFSLLVSDSGNWFFSRQKIIGADKKGWKFGRRSILYLRWSNRNHLSARTFFVWNTVSFFGFEQFFSEEKKNLRTGKPRNKLFFDQLQNIKCSWPHEEGKK